MNHLTDDSPQPTPREWREKKLIDPAELAKRFVFGVIGSCLFSAVMFFVQVKTFIGIVLAAILTFLGWTTEPPQEAKDAAAEVARKVEYEAKKHLPPIGTVGLSPFHESEEQIKAREQREAAARLSQLTTDRAKADALGITWDEDWPHEKFAVAIPLAEQAKLDAAAQARDDQQRGELIERATLVHFGVNPDLDLDEMKKQVEDAEAAVKADAAFQLKHRQWEEAMRRRAELIAAGPNANCPGCRFALRVKITNPTYKVYCPRCRYITSRRVMLAMHRDPPAPPEPQPPNMNPGLLGRLFR